MAADKVAPLNAKSLDIAKKIIKVFHTAVREVECNNGFELLGSHSFAWIYVENGRRVIEKNGIFEFQGGWGHYVAESNVNLNRNNGNTELSRGADPNRAMVTILAESRCQDVLGIEM